MKLVSVETVAEPGGVDVYISFEGSYRSAYAFNLRHDMSRLDVAQKLLHYAKCMVDDEKRDMVSRSTGG